MVLGTEKPFYMTTVMILVMLLIIFNFGSLQLLLVAIIFFYGLPIQKVFVIYFITGRPGPSAVKAPWRTFSVSPPPPPN